MILGLLILLPSTGGRFLLDLAGGFVLALFAIPDLIGGIGFISWKVLQSKMVTCEVCGMSSFAKGNQCPVCGSNKFKGKESQDSDNKNNISIPASTALIDIQVTEESTED